MPRDVLTIQEDDNDSDMDREEESDGGEGEESEDNEVNPNLVKPRRDPAFTFRNEKKLKKELQRKKKLTKKEVTAKRKDHVAKIMMGLVKPDVTTDKEKERLLRRIATKGVVQLFNAVSARQKTMSEELSKKLSAKQRKEAEERLRGANFDVYTAAMAQKAKEEGEKEDEMKEDGTEVKEEREEDSDMDEEESESEEEDSGSDD